MNREPSLRITKQQRHSEEVKTEMLSSMAHLVAWEKQLVWRPLHRGGASPTQAGKGSSRKFGQQKSVRNRQLVVKQRVHSDAHGDVTAIGDWMLVPPLTSEALIWKQDCSAFQ